MLTILTPKTQLEPPAKDADWSKLLLFGHDPDSLKPAKMDFLIIVIVKVVRVQVPSEVFWWI